MNNSVPVWARVLRFLSVCVMALMFFGWTALLVSAVKAEKLAAACESRKTVVDPCECRCECSCDSEVGDE